MPVPTRIGSRARTVLPAALGRFSLFGATLLLLSHIVIGSGLADPADVNWSSDFGAPGVEGEVRTMVNWNGTPVVGGNIPCAGGKPVLNVVAWNGTELVQLGDGLNGPVNSLAVVGTTLYAAGDFTASGATPLPNVGGAFRVSSSLHSWNGTFWAGIGSRVKKPGHDAAAPRGVAWGTPS